MTARSDVALPGTELIEPGLADLRAGRDTTAARAVLVARTRLVEAGLEVPAPELRAPAAHLLYESLARAYGAEASLPMLEGQKSSDGRKNTRRA